MSERRKRRKNGEVVMMKYVLTLGRLSDVV